MPRLRRLVLLILPLALAACGPARKSVFPPTVSIQQLRVQPDGAWDVTVRIQNNSYAGMDFTALDGRLALGEGVPVRLHGSFHRDIPALAGDTVPLQVWPTAAMTAALQSSAARGSAGAVPYRLSGTAQATPEQEDRPRAFDFSGTDWLSPVPGIPHTWR